MRRIGWGRGPEAERAATAPASLQDDRKHAFDKNDDKRNAERGNTAAHDARVEKIADRNDNWVRKNFETTAAGGTPLPPDLVKLKAASDASRTTPATTPTAINPSTVAACVAYWKQNWPNGKLLYELYQNNDFNREQLTNATQHLLQRGHAVDVQLAEDAFQLCYAGNHLDPRKRTDRAGNVVHLRGEARRPAPVPFPRVIWPDEQAAIEQEQQQKALAESVVEAKRAKSLPFDELKRQATKDRKVERQQMGPVVS